VKRKWKNPGEDDLQKPCELMQLRYYKEYWELIVYNFAK